MSSPRRWLIRSGFLLASCVNAHAQVTAAAGIAPGRIPEKVQIVPRVPGLSTFLDGLNAGVTYSGIHSSSVGWYSATTPASITLLAPFLGRCRAPRFTLIARCRIPTRPRCKYSPAGRQRRQSGRYSYRLPRLLRARFAAEHDYGFAHRPHRRSRQGFRRRASDLRFQQSSGALFQSARFRARSRRREFLGARERPSGEGLQLRRRFGSL